MGKKEIYYLLAQKRFCYSVVKPDVYMTIVAVKKDFFAKGMKILLKVGFII